MEDEVVFNKISIIERCLKRVREVYSGSPASLEDFTKQDSIILNILRACEASIDLAMHITAKEQLGLPQTSREAFDLLKANGVINEETAAKLKAMVGFRNIAVHDDQAIDLDILKQIIEKHLEDFTSYTKQILFYRKQA